MEIAISLGSNRGDRLEHLRGARALLARLPGTQVTASAPVYETEPVDVLPEHADKQFLNTLVIIETALDPHEVEEHLHTLEGQLGRVREADRNAPRPIDMDIIYADDLEISGGHLVVPHERWSERRFVVQPLADLRPDRVLPGQERKVSEVLLALPPRPAVVLFCRTW